jgi:carboxymethylenebutenolidase
MQDVDIKPPRIRPDATQRDVTRAHAGAGFAAAVQPVVAQTQIRTDSEGLVAGDVTIPVGEFAMPAYRAVPQGAQRPPVLLVVSEIFGVHEHIADVARRFAKLGYLAIAPALFERQGDPSSHDTIEALFAQVVSRVPDRQVMGDLDACVAWARSEGGDTDRLGITGFCWGGRMTWLYMAHQPGVKAGVAWYGRLTGPVNELQTSQPVDAAARLAAPVLGLYGGQDAGIPVEAVDRMKAALALGSDAARRSEIVVYPDAPHAFHADYRPGYRPEAAADGWARCLAWLRAHGVA